MVQPLVFSGHILHKLLFGSPPPWRAIETKYISRLTLYWWVYQVMNKS